MLLLTTTARERAWRLLKITRGDRECVRYVPVCAGNNGGQEDLVDKAVDVGMIDAEVEERV